MLLSLYKIHNTLSHLERFITISKLEKTNIFGFGAIHIYSTLSKATKLSIIAIILVYVITLLYLKIFCIDQVD